ncbi:hypothetical protein [Ramlibacter sp.]|uniref:hypothetical protein n=1 Tax=Ramlibacter sp. TaxID=1917967 RepID=UPI003D0CFBAB
MLESLFTLFKRTRLLNYEQRCLDGWRATLSESAKRVLDLQLSAMRRVQRQAGGAKLCFYPGGAKVPEFRPSAPDLMVSVVTLQDSNGAVAKMMRARVYVHRGHFFSIEFPKRPDRFAEQHQIDLDSLTVASVETCVELSVSNPMESS